MAKYIVYEQQTPVRDGVDRNGDAIYKANLVVVGVIDAPYSQRFDEARKHTRYPVIEPMGKGMRQ